MARSTRRPRSESAGSGGSPLARLRAVISRVPRGKVITYGDAAAAAGYPRAPRLTVRALHSDEALPWHRVVGAGGRISLRGIDGREQRLRLEMEGVEFRGRRIRMEAHAWAPKLRRPKDPRARGRRVPTVSGRARGGSTRAPEEGWPRRRRSSEGPP